MNALSLLGVSKSFGKVAACQNVSFDAAEGELISLLGPSGCGKTTTLRLIAGLERADSGQIFIKGRDLTDVPPYHRNIGMVFQSYALFPHMTAHQNAAFGLEMRRVPKKQIERQVREAFELTRLTDLADRYPKQLSGGQQQRVAVARALVTHPDLLLLDEPLSNLDAKLRDEMRIELRQIQQRVGLTTVFVTHDQEEALVMSDRVLVMSGGRVVECGTPAEIYHQPCDAFTAGFIGHSNLWEGTVAEARGAERVVQATTGSTIYVLDPQGASSQGDQVLVSVKEERIRLELLREGAEPSRPNVFRGEVHFATFLGAMEQYGCTVAGKEIRIRRLSSSGAERIRPGDAVAISWEPGDASLIRR